jgi:hypothetical protein
MHIQVAAELVSEGNSTAVRIRNLSPSGGLIEGASDLQIGCRFTLRKGSLSVEGKVRWKQAGQCGVAFCTPIDIYGWLTHSNPDQERVDQLVDAVRNGCGPGLLQMWDEDDPLGQFAELTELASTLDRVADALCTDAALAERHLKSLQYLDIAAQKFRKLAVLVSSGIDDQPED